MGKSVLELAVSTGRWEAGLKKAQQALNNFTDDQGGFQAALQKDSKNMQGFIQMMGSIDSHAKTSRGQLNDYKNSFEQFTLAYNQMSETEKRNPVGRAISQTLDQLRVKIDATRQQMDELNQSMNNATPPTSSGLFGGGKLDGMLQVFGGNLMTKGAGLVAGLVGEMKDAVDQGIELAKQGEGIRIAFERLGRGDILDGLREATHGTVSDIELMKAAVKFNDFRLPVEELGTMLAFAQQKAKDTGQSIDYMVDSIVTGLGRKSLMILDNLGLSAAEIKEKMAETGDMTKAVGEIIREQMQKAGDYVETAADRAAKQNVMLQNKMEELGRKFLPLKEASDNLWTSMKLGILDIIGGPLTSFINKLTEAGRLAQQYGVLGGSGKVGRLVNNLATTREDRRQSVYQQQKAEIWKLINPREQQIKDIRAWQRGERGEALQGRIDAIRNKYGTLDATKIQAEVDAYKKILTDYEQAVKPLLTPIKPEVDTNDAEQSVSSLTKKLKDLEKQRKAAIEAGDTELSKSLLKQINQVKADIKGLGGSTTTTTTTKGLTKSDASDLWNKMILGADITKNDPNRYFQSVWDTIGEEGRKHIIDNGPKQWDYGKVTDMAKGEWAKPKEKEEKKLTDELKKNSGVISGLAGGLNSITSGVKAMGFELPEEIDEMINGISGLAQIISGVGSIIEVFSSGSQTANTIALNANTTTMVGLIDALATNTFTSFIPHANGGVVGRAGGGFIPGNSFSGDRLRMPVFDTGGIIGVNSGELILNKSQQNALAQQLSDGGGNNLHLEAIVTGDQLRLVLKNNDRLRGGGTNVTIKSK